MDNERDREIYESFEVEVFPDRDRVIVAPRGEIDLVTVERSDITWTNLSMWVFAHSCST
jgi:hypothetical protein